MKQPDQQTESITTMEGANYSPEMCLKLFNYLQRDHPIGPYGANWRAMVLILKVPGSCPYKDECSVYKSTMERKAQKRVELNMT